MKLLFTCLAALAVSRVAAQVPALPELAGDWQEAAEVRSLPALNSTQGSAQAMRDVLAVGRLSFPPLTMTGDTGALLLNGQAPVLQETRWFPYQVLRRATSRTLGIETATRMLYEQRAVLFHIVVTNRGSAEQRFELKIPLCAATSRHSHWGWGVPRDKEAASRFTAALSEEHRALLLQDTTNHLANCFCFEHAPDALSIEGTAQEVGRAVPERREVSDGPHDAGRMAHDGGPSRTALPGPLPTQGHSGQALWHISLKPQGTATINYVLAFGEDPAAVQALAAQSARRFDAAFAQVQADWEARFQAMFTPGNRFFPGSLPVLASSDEQLRRVYYMSLVSLLSVYRTGFPVAPRVYVSNTPESNCTMMYFWDTREWATVFALLDPVALRECLRSWLGKGLTNGYAEEYLTGTLQGPWYSANDYSVFILLNAYLDVTGDRAFLREQINGQTVLEHANGLATHWKTLVRPGRTLADYGKAGNLLECVPSYIHEVPSFNAANVWMMRRAAALEAAEGHPSQAEALRAEAARLLPAVLALYEPGQGVWDSLHRDGTRVQMRHVFDFTTIGLTIGSDLSPQMRSEMSGFVQRELLTDHWMRAQSLSDPAAAKSDRPDHGPMGAFCAWPAETIAALCEFGEYQQALDFLHRVASVTDEGPFGQSRELMDKTSAAPVRIAERGGRGLPSQTYNASNGGGFAESIIRGFFGYQPDVLKDALVPNARPRGFQGQLLGVRCGGKIYDITSDAKGLQVSPVKP